MKKRSIFVLFMIFVLVLVECQKTNIRYSNQINHAVYEAFQDCKDIEKVRNWSNEFNSIALDYSFPQGFVSMPREGVDYDSLLMDTKQEAYSYLQWLNCRLTAFTLLKDKIHTNNAGTSTDTWLMFDLEAIDTVSEYAFLKRDQKKFETVFNNVSVHGNDTVKEQAQTIQQAWNDRGIKIHSNHLSLITVWVHSPEDQVRFVGHTGVLAHTKEGLLFLEKYSSMAPFQATYFQNRSELKKYLLSRKDLYGDSKELKPIVMENKIIVG